MDEHPPDEPTTVSPAGPPPPGEAMPPWVPRAIVLTLLGLAGLVILRWLFFALRSLIVMLLVSLFLSFAIEPAVNVLARRGWRRGAATGLVFVGLLVVTGIFVGAIGSLVANQVSNFVDEAPEYIEEVEEWVNDRFQTEISSDDLVEEITREEGPVRQFATRFAENAFSFGVTALGLLFQVFTIALFTFYLVADGPRLRRTICSALPPDRQRHVLRTWELAIEKTGGYIYSRALLALLSALASWVALTIIGVPFPVALALWVGVVSQFVPVVGTYIAGALPVLIALISDPVRALWTLGFIVVYQQFENYILQPRITAHTMALHPAVAFGTVIAGAGIMGPVGAILALPAAAVIQAFVSTYVQRHEVIESALTREPPRPGRGLPGLLPWVRRRDRRPPGTPAT